MSLGQELLVLPAAICYNMALMKLLRYLPLTFLAGVHGFAFFAPYLALFLGCAHLMTRPKRLAPVPVRA